MAKNYIVQFGGGNPTSFAGLSPTFIVFKVVPGGGAPTGATAPPGITQIPSSTGLYYFTYEPLTSVAFVIDGGNTLATSDRYVVNCIDTIQNVDETLAVFGDNTLALGMSLLALGNTNVALGTTGIATTEQLVGFTSSPIGDLTDSPTDVMGYLMRLREFNEGNSTFAKTSGLWSIYASGSSIGASTLLAEKTLSDNGTVVTKS
jgi:hypothetical protein